MKTQGEFKYFINGKEVLYKDLQAMIRLDMTVSVDGLNVYYSSPEEKDKPERSTYSKLEDVTISPKKVKDRLILAEKFKKKALDEMHFKNPHFEKEQVSQACYTTSEEVKRLIKERQEYSDRLAKEFGEEEILATILNPNLKVNEKRREGWFDASDFLEISLKTPQKQETVNRLVEEELERQEQQVFKDWECTNLGVLQGATQADWIDFIGNSMKRGKIISYKHKDFPKYTQEVINKEVENRAVSEALFGKKENSGKIDYSEIDFDILDLMANRFNANKHKYPHGNMLKPIKEKQLLFALLRHLKKMIQPIDNDPETFEEHLSAILCNAQMVYQQRKLKKN